MARAVDLFSGGGGGWCLAMRALGGESIGLEWDAPSCATRAVVGLPTIRTDVATYPAERFVGKVDGVTGSPPCQTFSSAGKGAGLADPRGQFVHEPMRYVRVIRPRWMALEQVKEVLPYWRWIAGELREMGYSVWTGILNAADYGVPQVRKRAILLASLDRLATPPVPTHSESGSSDLFGAGLPRYVTMAEALGWKGEVWTNSGNGYAHDYTRDTGRPAGVVTGRADRWKLQGNQRPGGSSDYITRDANRPSIAVTSRGNSYRWVFERPSTTIQCDSRVSKPGHHGPSGQMKDSVPVELWELSVLQGFPADHPWQPPYVATQIGNAIPPPLAEACLRSLVGPV